MDIKKILLTIISISVKMICLAVVIMAIYTIGIKAYDFGVKLFAEVPMEAEPGTDIRVLVTDDMSLTDIAKELQEKELIENSFAFIIKGKLAKLDKHITASAYTLNTSMTMSDMIDIFEEKYEEESSLQAQEAELASQEQTQEQTQEDTTNETTISE